MENYFAAERIGRREGRVGGWLGEWVGGHGGEIFVKGVWGFM